MGLAFEITEEIRISIHTSTTSDHRSDAILVIDDSETEGTKLIAPATLEIEADGTTAQLAMTGDELLQVGEMFVKQAKLMRKRQQENTH